MRRHRGPRRSSDLSRRRFDPSPEPFDPAIQLPGDFAQPFLLLAQEEKFAAIFRGHRRMLPALPGEWRHHCPRAAIEFGLYLVLVILLVLVLDYFGYLRRPSSDEDEDEE